MKNNVLAIALIALVAVFSLFMATSEASPPQNEEVMATVSASISSGADVIAAVSGKKLCVRSAVLRSSTAGVVVFRDGSGSGTILANIYLPQDANLVLDEKFFGEGIKTTAGNSLFATLSSATLTAVFRVAKE